MDSSKENIVLLPYMAHGHLIPFLALAKQLHQTTNFTITLLSTPLNINYLKSTLSKDSSAQKFQRINLIALPFNSSDHGLPPNTENTEALSLPQIITLFKSSTSLESPLRDFLKNTINQEGKRPICVIYDIFMGWADEVAKSLGIVNVCFTTGGAYGTAAYISIWQNLPHRLTDKEQFNVPGFPNSCYFDISLLHPHIRAANGSDPWSTFFQTQIPLSLNAIGWLCNTVQEIEPEGLDILKKYTKLPIWCTGPLLPAKVLSRNAKIVGYRSGREPGVSPEKCIEWLDNHSEGSVLYISFGSQNTISQSQMMDLAMGLEDSEKPFIWVIRPPFGFNIRGEFSPEWLPEKFEERMSMNNRGLVIHKWAPQLEILCHKSIRAFLSHCGWNSVMESLSQGVGLIGWPLAAEQGYNSKLLEEDMGVCVVLTKGLTSNIGKEKVKNVINLVMDREGKGEEMKRKAVKVGELIRDSMKEEGEEKGSSVKAMDDFVSVILRKSEEMSRQGIV